MLTIRIKYIDNIKELIEKLCRVVDINSLLIKDLVYL